MTVEHPLVRRERTNLKRIRENTQALQAAGQYPLQFQMPTGIQFELTGACNLRCKHCYNRSGDSDVQTRMKPENWLDLSRHIVENGGIFQCILSGGEPLLMGETLIKIMDILHEDNTGFVLISNGLLMNHSWIQKFRKYTFNWLQISIDDNIREKHDAFRGVTGSWDAAARAALGVSSAGIPLAIAHTITPDNLARLPEMIEFAYQLGAGSILCGETMVSGRAAENEQILLNEEQRGAMFTMIETLQKHWGNKIIIRYTIPEGIQLQYKLDLPVSSIIVRPNGDVRLDCTLPFTIGNVLETPFADIWRSKGIHSWKNPEVREYIQNLASGIINPDFINHVSRDRVL